MKTFTITKNELEHLLSYDKDCNACRHEYHWDSDDKDEVEDLNNCKIHDKWVDLIENE